MGNVFLQSMNKCKGIGTANQLSIKNVEWKCVLLGFFSTKLKKKELSSNFPSCPIYQTNWKSSAPLSWKV